MGMCVYICVYVYTYNKYVLMYIYILRIAYCPLPIAHCLANVFSLFPAWISLRERNRILQRRIQGAPHLSWLPWVCDSGAALVQ